MRDVWINPPPIPITTAEMDALYELPFQRVPHPRYQRKKIPAYEMIKFSVTIMRGCFGGCLCSITGMRAASSKPLRDPILRADRAHPRPDSPATGNISDGPTANNAGWSAKPADRRSLPQTVVRLPDICPNLGTDHGPLVRLYKRRGGCGA